MSTEKTLGVYIHIPFCAGKCAYCDFLSFEGKNDRHGDYVDAVLREVDIIPQKYGLKDKESCLVRSIYFGGGTPSSIDAELVNDILCKLKESFILAGDAEISIETNPGTLNEEKLKSYVYAGFNRLSIGLQSADNAELNELSRIHTREEFLESYTLAREAGFSNINVDIMTALPYQSEYTLSRTLDYVTSLEPQPEHISAYSLIVEPGTRFYDRFGEKDDDGRRKGPEGSALPDEEGERRFYYLVRDRLKSEGYKRYEISNFAKAGYESVHNSSYWTRRDYIGIGLGASSLVDNVRYRNLTKLDRYITAPGGLCEKIMIDDRGQIEEFMFLGLRCAKGVSDDDFYKCFGFMPEEIYSGVFNKLTDEGLISHAMGSWFLTDLGIDYGNYVFSHFLLQ